MPARSITVALNCDKFISVNDRLRKGGRGRNGRIPLTYAAEKEMSQLRRSLELSGVPEGAMSGGKYYTVSLVFYLKENLSRRDLDNLIKTVFDVVGPYFGFDDRNIISYKASKRQIKYPKGYPEPIEWLVLTVTDTDKQKSDLVINKEDFDKLILNKGE